MARIITALITEKSERVSMYQGINEVPFEDVEETKRKMATLAASQENTSFENLLAKERKKLLNSTVVAINDDQAQERDDLLIYKQ